MPVRGLNGKEVLGMTDTTAHTADAGTTDETSGAEFNAPQTQEDLDRIVQKRIERERSKFADYDDLKAKADRLAEIEEASKTEAEKQAEALASAQSELEQYKQRDQVRSWAQEIVTDSSVPADALRGSSREELQEHFEQLKALITPAPAKPTSDPVPGLGDTPATGNVTISEQIKAAEAAGNKELVAALKALQLSS